ncbi:hypothetical protein DFJ58DRAFT_749793 [Suillus subalutaceus]|uniref:uncharacterized protein n=1 Tax=Suillus subalutaceus TaxID=48586 RepID=UPI001B869DAB|nr:uncharacterized protein DFJ58DRAFT_749793 [Suillus subalutaceus]KAG1836391.1 hypothetical protein DFJ58DRAFT_749793 [Suillus subalutaceus]
MAMRQWISARHITKQFKDSGYPSVHPEQEQSEKEAVKAPEQRENRFLRFLVALAKGVSSVLVFLCRFPGALATRVKRSINSYSSEQSEDYTWTQTHSFFVLMGGFMLYVDETPYHTLQPDEIHDKSKGNAISKGLVMLQLAWFIMQLITRAIYHLETTQLEVGTLAFAVLNFLTYAVWWNKPLDVQCPYPVYWKSTESRPEDHIDIYESNQGVRNGFGILYPVFRPILETDGLA